MLSEAMTAVLTTAQPCSPILGGGGQARLLPVLSKSLVWGLTNVEAIERFRNLFRGFENAHGQHELFGTPDENGKVKGRAQTKGYGAGEKEYDNHLNGRGTSLGIIPLLADNTCWFGAIDIDIQGEKPLREKIEALEKRVRSLELPLVVCRSKSGGAHLYMFAEEPLAAQPLIAKLKEFAAALGYGGCEVFPKQATRVNEGDRGNWINIAYYGVLSKAGTDRYALKNGKPIKALEDFVKYAEMMRVDRKSLGKQEIKLSILFDDGPPCLQHLATFGFQEGGRNNSLYNIGVYLKKKSPDNWHDALHDMNQKLMKPPLDSTEVTQVIRNVDKKDYFYTCKQPPIANHCDKKLCAKRDFGITYGSDGELFPIDNITKCTSKDSVRWYAEIASKRFELTTEQLLSPVLLQRIVLEKFSIVIIPGKQKEWILRVKELMETCDEVTDPDDASRQGQFENLVDNFFSNSKLARNKDELIKGNAYVENKRIFFRSEDLLNYLTIRRFQHQPHEVYMWLKQMGVNNGQMRIKDKMIKVWHLPEPDRFDTTTGIALPQEVEEEL